ncbi:MAG: hypothetical protein ACTSYA_01705 [Candidatus Kariarchaeaceae archaeon]
MDKEERQKIYDEWWIEAIHERNERIKKIIDEATNEDGQLRGQREIEEKDGRVDTYRLNVYLPYSWGLVLEVESEANRTSKKEIVMRGLKNILFPELKRPTFLIPPEITDQIREGFQMIDENLEGLDLHKKAKDLIDSADLIKELIETRATKDEFKEELYREKMKRHILQALINSYGRLEYEEVKHKVKNTYYYESDLTPERYFRPEIFEKVLGNLDMQIVHRDEEEHQEFLYLEF